MWVRRESAALEPVGLTRLSAGPVFANDPRAVGRHEPRGNVEWWIPLAICPICANGGPLDVVAETGTIWITAQVDAPLPGYACVVSKRHVTEPFELPMPELLAFWQEAMFAARTLDELYQPTKMNYEIHGIAELVSDDTPRGSS